MTKHVRQRAAQRGVREKDLSLLSDRGTETESGFFMDDRALEDLNR